MRLSTAIGCTRLGPAFLTGPSLLTSGQSTLLAKRTAGFDLEELIRSVKGCGFDENRYVENNPDLRNDGFDGPQGMLHFLAIGHQQRRDATCGPLPDGLEGIRSLAPRNRDYITGLFRSLFFSQARQAGTTDRLWDGIDRGVIDGIRDMGGQPYFVIGDSHTYHYLRRTSLGEKWLAALPIVCVGAAAMRLATDDSRAGFGKRILQWAKNNAAFGQSSRCSGLSQVRRHRCRGSLGADENTKWRISLLDRGV